jgi:hypothetical protein
MNKKEIIKVCKFRNSKKIFCEIHKSQKLEFYYNQRLCKICLTIRQKNFNKKRNLEKSKKFQFFGVIQ